MNKANCHRMNGDPLVSANGCPNRPPRRLPIGAEILADNAGVHFRVWAPKRSRVDVVFENGAAPDLALSAEADGYFAGIAPQARTGMRYRFRLDNGQYLYPDPASRFQ